MFIVAPDKFKGSLSAIEAAELIARSIKKVLPDAEVKQFPLSDGGEGLVDTLITSSGGTKLATIVTGPLNTPVEAQWGIIDEGNTAIIEMASASGLLLVPEKLRDPTKTTSFGTGELIRTALDYGCQKIIIGIGGSATNDGGAGMARALGVKFIDRQNRLLKGGGGELKELTKIDLKSLDPRIKKTEIVVACDVNNPLTGPKGASHVYGRQKGASAEMVEMLDQALINYASVIRKDLNIEIEMIEGAGAAGGLGAGLMAFLGAELKPGIDLVLDTLKIDQYLTGCDLVITGEGKLDGQSIHGKAPLGIARRAKRYNIPVIALAGKLESDLEPFHREGLTACFAIADGPLTLEESMAKAPQLLESKTAELIRLWQALKITPGNNLL